MAHAVLGAVVGHFNGNAAVGAAGAFTAEAAAPAIIKAMGWDKDKLTEQQKQTVSALGTLAAGLAGGLVGNSSSSAVAGMEAGKNAVENNSLSGDAARETVKQTANTLKDQVRDKLGEGTLSAIVNSIIGVAADTGDTLLGTADYGADTAMALTSCAMGDSYCTQALNDLAGKNQTAADTLKALIKSETWAAVAEQVKEAAQGNQLALEATGGILASIILPGKKVPHVPNAGAVGNMGEFFKQAGFGSEIKEISKKTSKQYQGQSVYQANKPVGDYIQKGDQFYLDAKHKDHIEVFDSTGTKVRAVLNLDGSFNDTKTKAAKAEGRRLPK
ncbi:VENN motif pre-toxin domain-containing protein [Yersinia aldovae]|uniref:Adhesin/hemagglutinin n=1 Tax=Yersinia aldovae TaxID=29483 RepID=A0ABM9SYM2_YERAL|nr:VENN motif pre-toxin domain-containing protein [Yersinia aldovae]CNL81917.1 adhesin/hemagglutinin [Yersinia aldovae]